MASQKKLLWAIFLAVVFLAAGLVLAPRPPGTMAPVSENGITQIATIDSLLAGVYDGETTLEELRGYGDFGIGTFQSLDGEMILLDGLFYQVKGDGKVYRPEPSTTSPFAAVLPFEGDIVTTAVEASLDYEALCREIDRLSPNPNVPIAVHLKGRFTGVRTRSVPAQTKPYKPLAEVTKDQPEFELGTVEGEVVGFRLPPYVRGINVPGYHLHFLTHDRKRGGHLLRLGMESGEVRILQAHRFRILLPQRIVDFAEVDLSKDRSDELEKVEK